MPEQLKRKIIIILTACILISFTTAVFADNDSKNNNKESNKSAVSAKADEDFLSSYYDSSMMQTEEEKPIYVVVFGFIFKLSIIVLMIIGVVYGLKKFGQVQSKIVRNNNKIQVMDTVNIAAGRSLHIVKIGSKHILIGSSANEISFLKDLDKEDVEQEKLEHIEQKPVSQKTTTENNKPGFKAALNNYMSNIPDNASSAQRVAGMIRDTSSFIHEQIRDLGTSRKNFQ
ncbi:MAG: flagellar biosynthetic protein FliO [Armatimonadota bacterium]